MDLISAVGRRCSAFDGVNGVGHGDRRFYANATSDWISIETWYGSNYVCKDVGVTFDWRLLQPYKINSDGKDSFQRLGL